MGMARYSFSSSTYRSRLVWMKSMTESIRPRVRESGIWNLGSQGIWDLESEHNLRSPSAAIQPRICFGNLSPKHALRRLRIGARAVIVEGLRGAGPRRASQHRRARRAVGVTPRGRLGGPRWRQRETAAAGSAAVRRRPVSASQRPSGRRDGRQSEPRADGASGFERPLRGDHGASLQRPAGHDSLTHGPAGTTDSPAVRRARRIPPRALSAPRGALDTTLADATGPSAPPSARGPRARSRRLRR